jgi:hypothetical protein
MVVPIGQEYSQENIVKGGVRKLINMNYEHTKIKNKISSVIFLIFSILFLIISFFLFVFTFWKGGLIFLGIAILFYVFSKLGKWANKKTEKVQQNFNKNF